MKFNTASNLIMMCVLITIRIIPHPWNLTPLMTFAFLSRRFYPRATSVIVTTLCLFISDTVLAYTQHHATLGSWSFFTYTYIAFIAFTCQIDESQISRSILMIALSSIGFWVWTNFGCWLSMPEYSKDIKGLTDCYIMALPFLKNQFFGDFLWTCLTLGTLNWFRKNQMNFFYKESPS